MSDTQIRAMAAERAALAERLGFLDCSVWLGTPEGFPLAIPLEAGDLDTGKMRRDPGRKFVRGGLVSHWSGKLLSAQDGNQALAAVEPHLGPEWHTVWTALPFYPREPGLLPGPATGSERMRAARIFPRTHGYPATEWALGELCRWMISRRLPLFVWHTEIDWSALRALCLAFPGLPVVLESQPRKIIYHTRPLAMVMRDCPSLRLEISNCTGPRFVELAAREFGAARLLYGSFLPAGDPLVPLGMVVDADVPEDDKRLIASRNLAELVGGVRA